MAGPVDQLYTHLKEVRDVVPLTPEGCEECLRAGSWWVHLDTTAPDSATARIAFLRGLRAVRQLQPDPLPDTVLHDILEVARWSGSAGNRQPWEFVGVRNRDFLA